MRPQGMRQAALKGLLLTTTVSASALATAIGGYRLVPLPDLGFGGDANSFVMNAHTTTTGNVIDPMGHTRACIWRSSNNWSLQVLPDLQGANSVAFGGAAMEDAEGMSVHAYGGDAETPAGIAKPVLWIEDSGGSISIQVLPTLGGSTGQARSLAAFGDSFGIVGSAQKPNGVTHATFWFRTLNGYQAIDIGTLGGQNSQAERVVADSTGEAVVVGSAQMPSGAWHACSWFVDPQNPTAHPITDDQFGGPSSVFKDCTGPSGAVRFACGSSANNNGRMTAFDEIIYSGHAGLGANLTVPGMHNSSASGIASTVYGDLVAGAAWDDPANPLPVVWNTISTLGATTPYSMNALCLDDLGPLPLTLHAIGEKVAVGSFLDGDIDRPVVFAEDGTQLPDTLVVTKGTAENSFRETDIWKSGDGNTLRVRTVSSQNEVAKVAMTLFGCETKDKPGDMISMRIRCRALGNSEATGRVKVAFLGYTTEPQEGDATFICSSSWQTVTVQVPGAGLVDPATGEVKVSMRFKRTAGNARGFEIDEATLTPNP